MKQILALIFLIKGFGMYAQCSLAYQTSPDNTIQDRKKLGFKLGDDKNLPELTFVRIDTTETKGRPLYYLTILIDTTATKNIFTPNRLTLWFGNKKKVTLESEKVGISELIVIFHPKEIFFRIDSRILDQMMSNQLSRIVLIDKWSTNTWTYDIDKNYIGFHAQCIKNAW